MPLNFNNTNIETLIKDGVEIKDLVFGNKTVYRKRTFTSNFTFVLRWERSDPRGEPTVPNVYIRLLKNGSVIKTITITTNNYTKSATWDVQQSAYRWFRCRILTANIPITFNFFDDATYSVKFDFSAFDFRTSSDNIWLSAHFYVNKDNSTYKKDFDMFYGSYINFPLGTDNVAVTFQSGTSGYSGDDFYANTSPVSLNVTQSS